MTAETTDVPRRRLAIAISPHEIVAVLIGGLAFLAIWNVSAPPRELLFSDFNQAYLDAALRLVNLGPVVTWPLNDTCTEGFVNIPMLGWLFAPLALMPPSIAATVFTAIGVLMLAGAVVLLISHFGLDRRQSSYLILLTLANGPLVHGLREGNTTHMALALLIIALVLMQSGYPLSAGALLGVCALLKLPLLLLGAYLLIARRWRVAAGFTSVGAAVVVASVIVFGPLINLGWMHYCVMPFLSGTMPGFNVQSLESFIFRLMNGPEHLHTWYLLPTPVPARIARGLVSLGLVAGALWLLAIPRPAETRRAAAAPWTERDLTEFNLVLTASVVASPLSWSHYYVLLILPWALHICGALPSARDRACRWMMGSGMVLSSLPVLMLPKDLGPLAPLLSRTVVSACFIGGVLTFAALVRGAWLARGLQNGAPPPLAPWVHAARRVFALRSKGPLSPSEALTRSLLILLLANVALGAAMWLLAPAAYTDVALQHTWSFLKGLADDDSWGPMANALRYIEHEYYPPANAKPLYSALVFEIGDKYQYPPFALFIAAALRDATEALAPFLAPATAVSWVAVAVTAAAMACILETSVRRTLPAAREDHLMAARAAIAVALALTYYPIVKSFTLGQIQTWINASLAGAVLLWMWRWKVPAGLLLGLCALVKPHYALLVVWAALRREWSFAAAGLLVIALGVGAALVILGWEHHVDYLQLLSFLSRHGEAFYPNHSINGLLNRFMSLSDPIGFNNLFWSESTFPPYTWWVHATTTASAVLIMGAALLRRRDSADRDRSLDLCVVALSCTMASPIAWEHHYGVLAPILALLAPLVMTERKLLAWLCVGYVLSSQYFPLTKLLASTPLNVLQSYLLFGAAIVLVILHILRGRRQNAAQAMA